MWLQTNFTNIAQSTALEQRIREKADKLVHKHPHIVGCHVWVEAPHKHQHQGRRYSLKIDLHVPGHQIVVNRDYDEDVYVALRDAFAAAERKLEEHDQRQRGDVKYHESRTRPSPVENGEAEGDAGP